MFAIREEMDRTKGVLNDVTDDAVRRMMIIMGNYVNVTKCFARQNVDWAPLIMSIRRLKLGVRPNPRPVQLGEYLTKNTLSTRLTSFRTNP